MRVAGARKLAAHFADGIGMDIKSRLTYTSTKSIESYGTRPIDVHAGSVPTSSLALGGNAEIPDLI